MFQRNQLSRNNQSNKSFMSNNPSHIQKNKGKSKENFYNKEES